MWHVLEFKPDNFIIDVCSFVWLYGREVAMCTDIHTQPPVIVCHCHHTAYYYRVFYFQEILARGSKALYTVL